MPVLYIGRTVLKGEDDPVNSASQLILFEMKQDLRTNVYVGGLKISRPRPQMATISARIFPPKLVHLS